MCSREFHSPEIKQGFAFLESAQADFVSVVANSIRRELDLPGKNTGFLSNVEHKFYAS